MTFLENKLSAESSELRVATHIFSSSSVISVSLPELCKVTFLQASWSSGTVVKGGHRNDVAGKLLNRFGWKVDAD